MTLHLNRRCALVALTGGNVDSEVFAHVLAGAEAAPADADAAIRSQREDVILRIDGKFGEQ